MPKSSKRLRTNNIIVQEVNYAMKNKINITDSKLENSPIVVDSYKPNKRKENPENNNNIFSNPWFKFMIIPIIVIVVGAVMTKNITTKIGGGEMPKDQNEININNSKLHNSPIIQNPPNAQLNINKQGRHLNPDLIAQLNQKMGEYNQDKIIVQGLAGDREALKFANEIAEYYESKGYTVLRFDIMPLGGTQKDSQTAGINGEGVFQINIWGQDSD